MHVALMALAAVPGVTRHEQLGTFPSPGIRPAPHCPMEVVEYHSPPKYVPRFLLPGMYAWCWAGSRPTERFINAGQ